MMFEIDRQCIAEQMFHNSGVTGIVFDASTNTEVRRMDVHRTYIPAAGHDWTLPFYDPLVKLLGGDAARLALVRQAALQPTHHVLEIGCGTGTLLMMIKREHPGVSVVGLDPDERALARAQHKADAASVAIELHRCFSDALPYADATFDRVFSSFMFHHLKGVEERQRTLSEIRRVLKPGGRLQLLDFAPLNSRKDAVVLRRLHSSHLLKDNTEAQVLSLMAAAGLANPRTLGRSRMLIVFHTAYYEATAPEGIRV